MRAVLTVLGSGTSMGVPTIGCDCSVCHSADPRDRRSRPSVLIEYGGKTVLIDTTPDFRDQATYADPHRYPTGGRTTVIVNGTVVVDHAAHTGALPGIVLRRTADGSVG